MKDQNEEFDVLSVLLKRLQLNTEIFVHAEYCGRFAVDTSGSQRIAFHLIERGEAWLHIDNEPARQLFAGDFVVFPHDEPHRIYHSSTPPEAELINAHNAFNAELPVTSMLCGFFEFTAKAAWPILSALPNAVVLELANDTGLAGTHHLIKLILLEMKENEPGSNAVLQSLAHALFIHVLRTEMQRGLDVGLLAALADTRLAKAIQSIHSDPGADWNLDSLSRTAGMSCTAFTNHFKAVLHTTPMRYVSEWRMQEAVELLSHSSLSMLAIAEQCGYRSEVAFRKAFKSIVGKPPGAVRRAAK